MADTVWMSKLDEKYDCRVTRTGERTGILTMINLEDATVLVDREVGLSYGAKFGPDFADVQQWQDICVEAVEKITK